MLAEEELRDAALLVFANKQDQPGAKGASEISEALRLGDLKDRNWTIMACSAIDGRGIQDGMDWLVVSGDKSTKMKDTDVFHRLRLQRRIRRSHNAYFRRWSMIVHTSFASCIWASDDFKLISFRPNPIFELATENYLGRRR